ncbi:MAG: arabinogalactan endo-1,4-beta-galactosidase, partial [Bacteroidia bacterium]|nr:arabinogalactan endo-1,4-beta-galactosidase [Bacteroidia bacterium]
MYKNYLILIFALLTCPLFSQDFYFGADMSYVNEMEHCGVKYYENNSQEDPYTIFANHGCNLVRLRLWHTPSWYDELNDGTRFSDLNDVKKAIARAREHNQKVLLDFHLSDNWADPGKQLVPEAWLAVVDDIDILKDSLYNYIFKTLSILNDEDLVPEMIQIGNETNKGILLSPEDNATWTLDWTRNAILFNEAIKAVRDFESIENKEVQVMLHLAGPGNAEWLLDGFIQNGVTDFDIIGLSYYWAWHKPTT